MKKFIALVLVMLMTGAAYADATFDLMKALQQTPEKLTAKRVQSLLKRGANVHYEDENGLTPLMHAFMNNAKTEAIKALLEAGADVDIADHAGNTVLMYACMGQTNTKTEIVRMILEDGVNVNAQNKLGQSAIMCIAGNYWNDNAHEIARLLIEYGAYIDETDNEGNGVLYYVNEDDDEMREIINNAPKG